MVDGDHRFLSQDSVYTPQVEFSFFNLFGIHKETLALQVDSRMDANDSFHEEFTGCFYQRSSTVLKRSLDEYILGQRITGVYIPVERRGIDPGGGNRQRQRRNSRRPELRFTLCRLRSESPLFAVLATHKSPRIACKWL